MGTGRIGRKATAITGLAFGLTLLAPTTGGSAVACDDFIELLGVIVGTDGNDVICASDSTTRILAGKGNDLIVPAGNSLTIDGEDGIDTIDMRNSPVGVTLDLAVAEAQNTGFGVLTVSGVENVRGSGKGDVLKGTAGANRLVGRGGGDRLVGRGGPDVLIGGRGRDVLRGGSGHDVLKGNAGRDSLYGGRGRDTLRGGSGVDTCRGGPGADRRYSCER